MARSVKTRHHRRATVKGNLRMTHGNRQQAHNLQKAARRSGRP